MKNNAIGVFDSGLGGLTAVKELVKILPNESIIYFGDTGRVPYGTRSEETIIKYTKQDIAFFEKFSVKAIICACGTASSVGLPNIKNSKVPVIGVVEPTARAAVKATKNKKIGIIGTEGTVNSASYEKAIKAINPDIYTVSQACTLFVPFVENGYLEHEATRIIAKEYLEKLKREGIDTLILGCTHYPLLKKIIGDIMGEGVTLIDAGKSAADYVKELLVEKNLLSDSNSSEKRFYTSDTGEKFVKTAEIFLNEKIDFVEKVDIEKVSVTL